MRLSLRRAGLSAFFVRLVIAFICLFGLPCSKAVVQAARADDGGMMSFVLGEGARAGGRERIYLERRYYAPPLHSSAQIAHKRWRNKARLASSAHLKSRASHAAKSGGTPRAPASSSVSAVARDAGTGREHAHFSDRTLRRGDIVATVGGLKVFKGAEHFPYTDADFQGLAKGPRLQNHAMLEAIDRVIRRENMNRGKAKPADGKLAFALADARTAKSALAPATIVSAYAPALAAAAPAANRAIERVAPISKTRLRAAFRNKHLHMKPANRPSVVQRRISPRLRVLTPIYFSGFWRASPAE